MLRFRSFPIRLMRTFFMGVPLLLGLTAETQTMVIPMLKHKEGYPRTEAIRISLMPRAGTFYVPQMYEAEIVMNSQLPWGKEIVHSWKWTFYVWTSLYVYVILLIVLVCFFKSMLFPSIERDSMEELAKEAEDRSSREERDAAESLRRWRRNRNRRKEMLSHGRDVSERVELSASSITITREDAAAATDEDVGESVAREDATSAATDEDVSESVTREEAAATAAGENVGELVTREVTASAMDEDVSESVTREEEAAAAAAAAATATDEDGGESVTREETAAATDEDAGDSESVCLGGEQETAS